MLFILQSLQFFSWLQQFPRLLIIYSLTLHITSARVIREALLHCGRINNLISLLLVYKHELYNQHLSSLLALPGYKKIMIFLKKSKKSDFFDLNRFFWFKSIFLIFLQKMSKRYFILFLHYRMNCWALTKHNTYKNHVDYPFKSNYLNQIDFFTKKCLWGILSNFFITEWIP